MVIKTDQILAKLPYSEPFLFVDSISKIDDNGVEGVFTFSDRLDFYRGHFAEFPITPGVILTETMAQIGLVCLGIYLLGESDQQTQFALSSTEVEFLKPVFPNETVTVKSEKIYFRFGKLKCRVSMINSRNEEVCNGIIAGMITNR